MFLLWLLWFRLPRRQGGEGEQFEAVVKRFLPVSKQSALKWAWCSSISQHWRRKMMAAKSAAVWREVLNGECLSPVHLHSWQRCTNMNGKKKDARQLRRWFVIVCWGTICMLKSNWAKSNCLTLWIAIYQINGVQSASSQPSSQSTSQPLL